MKTKKKIIWISALSVDVLLTIFLFTISIIMLATMPQSYTIKQWQKDPSLIKNFIQWFQAYPLWYLFLGVIPLFILFIGNIIGLVLYLKKADKKKKVGLKDLSQEEKDALRNELLNDIQKENK